MERVKAAAGMGGERGGTLPRLGTAEEGWERKEGEGVGGGRGGAGYGGASYGGATGASAGGMGGGYGYEGQEEVAGVPAGSGREKYPSSWSDFWHDWKLGLTYNNSEWGDALFWRAVLAEGCATTAFTFFLLSTWISLQGGGLTETGILRISLSAGLAYGVLNWIFHSVSGGHMNPAVTVATMLNCRISSARALCYIAAQIVGAIAGAAMSRAMNPSSFRVIHGGANRLNVGWRAGFLGEIMGTLLVVFAFLVAYDRRRRYESDHVNVLAPLMIGLAVTAAHLFLVPFTWCSINPARSLGAAIIANRWTKHWVWWAGPIVAAVAGPLTYESFFKHFYSTAPTEEQLKARQAPYGQEQSYGQPRQQQYGQQQQFGQQQQQQREYGQHQQLPGVVGEEQSGVGMSTFK